MPHCRGCGEAIVWLETTKGEMMPCNPKIVTVYQPTGFMLQIQMPDEKKETVVADNGQVITGTTERPPGYGDEKPGEMPKWYRVDGRISHWATCTQRKRFRTR